MLKINLDRLKQTINKSAEIGKTNNGGLNRLALTCEDKIMRDLFIKWMSEAGLKVKIDDFGNIYGHRKGQHEELPPVMIGSHLDTQPKGGRFDGILGVLSALEVIKTLNDNNVETYRPIEIVNFTNEEGARFEPPLLGSGGMSEIFSKEFVYNIKDKDGVSFIDALKNIDYVGEEKNRSKDIHSFVELHIEQGPVLEDEKINIGVVQGILGMSWLEVTVKGKGGHAGPTPMHLRNDALPTVAKIVDRLNTVCREDEQMIMTMGRMSVSPNIVNCIPEEITFTIDVRHPEDSKREKFIALITETINDISTNDGTSATIHSLWDENTTHFHPKIISTVEDVTEDLKYTKRDLYSGAGHDSMYINRIAPTSMIFIPSIGGISHVEHELSLDEDIERGGNVLLNTTLQLAQMKNSL